MGTRYVVTVMKVEDVEGSESRYNTRDTVLFEATHTDPARLAVFAPGEVVAALIVAGGGQVPAPVLDYAPAEPLPEAVPMASEGVGFPPAVAEPEVPKRTRRTKAQKAADDAAQARGFRDAAHQAETEQASATARDASVFGATDVSGAPLNDFRPASGTPGAAEVQRMASAVGADPSPENQAALGSMAPASAAGAAAPFDPFA